MKVGLLVAKPLAHGEGLDTKGMNMATHRCIEMRHGQRKKETGMSLGPNSCLFSLDSLSYSTP